MTIFYDCKKHKEDLLIDMDGVIVDWISPFDEFVQGHGIVTVNDYDNYYRLSDRYHGEENHLVSLMKEFNTSKNISSLCAFRDAATYLPMIRELGYNIHIISAVGNSLETIYNRSDNIVRLFGRSTISSLTCVDINEDKQFVLQKWKNTGCLWVEDVVKNAYVGQELGLQPILVDHKYNAFDTVLPRVSNEKPWENIYSMLTRGDSDVQI